MVESKTSEFKLLKCWNLLWQTVKASHDALIFISPKSLRYSTRATWRFLLSTYPQTLDTFFLAWYYRLAVPKWRLASVTRWQSHVTYRPSKLKQRALVGEQFYQILTNNTTFTKKNHATFRPLFHLWTQASWVSLSIEALLRRFRTATELLGALFYYNYGVVTLGTPVLWNETLTLNWLQVRPASQDFPLLRNKFFFHDQKLSPPIHDIFTKLNFTHLETAFVTDVTAHRYNITHLKRLHYFLIGLTPTNFNPWLLHFPIPTFTQNILVPHYLLRLAYFALVRAKRLRFGRARRLWKL